MKVSETRREARELLKAPSGRYQLFIVPIVLAILTVLISYRQAIFTASSGAEFSIIELVPSIIGILSALFLASASCAVPDVIRLKRDHVETGNSMIAFSNELFGEYILTVILKWLFLPLWSLIVDAGIFIFAIGITYTVVGDPAAGQVIMIIGLIVMAAGLVPTIMKNCSYNMVTYIPYNDAQDDTYGGPRNITDKNAKLAKGNRWRFLCP